MKTTWRVIEVVSRAGQTRAELVCVEWFKTNPEYDRLMADENYDGEMPDEAIEAEPGDETAEYIEQFATKHLVIDITDGLDLKPEDNVVMTLDLIDAPMVASR